MQNNKYKNFGIISATIAFVIIFAFLVVEIYTSTLEEEKRDYQLQQVEIVRNVAGGIIYFIEFLAADMRFLSESTEVTTHEDETVDIFDQFLSKYESGLVKSIFITDNIGNILHSSKSSIPKWISNQTKKGVQDFILVRDTKYYITPVARDEATEDNSQLTFQILMPLVDKKNRDTTGYLGYVLNFNSLIQQFIKPLKLSKNDFAWVMDGKGNLIYHPLHDEMLFNSVNDTTKECFDCHSSFEIQKSLLREKTPSTLEYEVIGDEPPKVMAYYPIQIQNQKWILVVSAFINNITENLRSKFKIFFILGFVTLSVLIFFSLLIYYINLKRIRAEAAARNLEQKQIYQEQLSQASKMASIGELVDSVAHEINTPAGIISAHVDGYMMRDNLPDDISDILKMIKKQTKRISDYTRSLLNYSKRIPFYPEKISVQKILDECIYLLGHSFRAKKIDVRKYYEENLPEIIGDQGQLEQVFINLLNNSVDAITEKGEIKIEAKKILQENSITGIIISIEDTGTGISIEEMDKIFNPFFSTKLNSGGTGLGLSIAKAIIHRHKGKITVESIPDQKTIFTVFLPSDFNKL